MSNQYKIDTRKTINYLDPEDGEWKPIKARDRRLVHEEKIPDLTIRIVVVRGLLEKRLENDDIVSMTAKQGLAQKFVQYKFVTVSHETMKIIKESVEAYWGESTQPIPVLVETIKYLNSLIGGSAAKVDDLGAVGSDEEEEQEVQPSGQE